MKNVKDITVWLWKIVFIYPSKMIPKERKTLQPFGCQEAIFEQE